MWIQRKLFQIFSQFVHLLEFSLGDHDVVDVTCGQQPNAVVIVVCDQTIDFSESVIEAQSDVYN